jgi:iron complex outermembrane receptor protein
MMKYYLTLMLLFIYARAGAQSSEDTLKSVSTGSSPPQQPLTYKLSEVSVTAYHNPERFISVAGAVSILPIDSLQFSGYNIVSALSATPGLSIQEATPGTMKLTLRGIGSRYPYGTKKIKMFFDGIPLYSAEGETYFDDISPEWLSRIEILRGPASGIYGASLGGAVVLYPVKSETNHSDLSFMNSFGSYGYLKNTLSYSENKGKTDIMLSYSGVKSDGYRENSNYLRNSLFLNINHSLGEKLSGELLISGSVVTAHIPSSVDSATFVSDPRAAAPSWLKTGGKKNPDRILFGYKLKYDPSGSWEIITSLFNTYRKNEENRPFNFLDESDVSYGGRVLARYAGKSGHTNYKITTGSNLFFELYDNTISENPGGMGEKGVLLQKGRESLYQVDAFSQVDLYVADFIFTVGFNINKSGFRFTDLYSSDTVDQSGSGTFDPVLSPRISVSWSPARTVSSYIAVNHGFTIPSLSETMTPLGLINTDIKPEKAWSYEAGARFDLFHNWSFIDLALYYMKVSDLIVPKRIAEDFYIGMNAGASLHKGIEISLQQWLFGKRENNKPAPLSGVMNVSYSINSFRFLDFTEGEDDFSGNLLPGIPEKYFTGSIDLKSAVGIYSRIEVLSSARIPLDDFNSHFTDPWSVLNARAGYSFSLGKRWGFDAMMALNNITNKRYASMVVVNAPGTEENPPRSYYPGMPRWYTFTVGLKYRFNRK